MIENTDEFTPRFCRRRGCNLPFGHDRAQEPTPHEGPQARIVGMPFMGSNRAMRRATGQVRMGDRAGKYKPLSKQKAQPLPGVAERMAEYRARADRRHEQNRLARNLEKARAALAETETPKPKRVRKAKAS